MLKPEHGIDDRSHNFKTHFLMDASSRKRFQQAIDLEIKSLEESLQALKSQRNAYSAISSLPPEVFATIFSILCLPGKSSLDGKPDIHLAQLVSHVCHQWREIIINQPLLWSHVNFTALSSEGAAEILVRAKSTPLSFEASLYGNCRDNVSTLRRELQAHLLNVRQLTTSGGPTNLDDTFEEIVSLAPTLEYLSLSSRDNCRDRRYWERPFIPDTLFNGSTPRLSCLELSYCDISWKSPLLRGLKYLKILAPSTTASPELADWLGALDEMPQLVTLTLHSASPITLSVPFDVERMVTLPSLTRLDILAVPGDCALALAHLNLPALSWLCLTACSLPSNTGFQRLLPHVPRHAHGPHDTQPLQSVLICSKSDHVNILAWSLPDIDVEAHDPPTLLSMTRVALSFRSHNGDWIDRIQIIDTVMAGLPLDALFTLATHDENYTNRDLQTQPFWLHFSPKWPLLKRVQLSRHLASGFIEMLLEDDGGRERPLLPSLTELTLVGSPSYELSTLYDALMKRVKQGVPMEMLDLSMCSMSWCCDSSFQSLTEVVVDILGPEKSFMELDRMESMWATVARGSFDILDVSGYERYW